jgi:thiol-disulfide isomerase/thioredoxin
MKKYLLSALCICAAIACPGQRPAIVERPAFDVRNSATLEIDRIEISDTATVLHINAFFNPKDWIAISGETYIRESGSSAKLPITRSEGINTDEQYRMPKSGKASFRLFFPPLPAGVTRIDLIESDCSNCFKTWGIRLLPDDKVTVEPIAPEFLTATATRPLPPPVIGKGTAKLSGKYFGYVDGYFMTGNEIILSPSGILNDRQQIKLPIAADGSFSGEVPLDRPQIVTINNERLFLTPGESHEVYIDLKKICRNRGRYRTDKEPGDSLYMYVRSSAQHLSTLDVKALNKANRLYDLEKLLPAIANMNRDQFKEYILAEIRTKTKALKQAGYSENICTLIEQDMKVDAFELLLNADRVLQYASSVVNKTKIDNEQKTEAPPIESYTFLKELLDDRLAYSENYPSIVAQMSHLAAFRHPEGGTDQEKFAYFKEKIAPLLGADKGLLYDVVYAQSFARQLQEAIPFTDADQQQIRTALASNPGIVDLLTAENDKIKDLLASLEKDKTNICEVPDVAQEAVFDTILARYRGKVVLIDFWATWCVPCIRAHGMLKPLKAELKGKDVVFLYLTSGSSPLANWYQMIPDIQGEHYRVSAKQNAYWNKVFQIQGVPTYFIYDREGKESYRSTGFPGASKMREEIEKLL